MTGQPGSCAPGRAVLDIDGARILAVSRGAAWWLGWRRLMFRAGRAEILTATSGCDVDRVACDELDDAEALRDHGTGLAGITRSALRVRRT